MVGTEVILPLEFRDSDDDLADPTTIDVRVLNPDGTVVTYDESDPEITGGNPDTGLWEFTWTPAEPGEYWVYVVGVGGGASVASERLVKVRDTHVPLS